MAEERAGRDLQLIHSIGVLHARISANQHALLRAVAEFDDREAWRDGGCRDMAQWLSGELGISHWVARRCVAAAHALRHLPRIARALETGVLCLDKVLELARFATPESEPELIPWARRVSVAAIRTRAERANQPELEEAQDAERARSLRWWWFEDRKRMGLMGEFPAAQGAAIVGAIRRLADKLPELPNQEESFPDLDPSPQELLEARCADALSALASQAIAADADSDRATVVVHTVLNESSLGPRFSELAGGPVLNVEVARRLACDARLQFVLTDKDGNALGIGHTSRNVPAWLMRELLFRDHGCTFPGCGTRAYLQAHHIVHWDFGGATDLDNLVLTCHFHHKLVHEFGWGVALNESMAEWFRPTGERFDPGPDPPTQLSIEVAGPTLMLATEKRFPIAV